MQRFDQVANVGFAKIEWWELYSWYGQQRIGKTVWRDLKARFSETSDDESLDLYIYTGVTELLLVHPSKMERLSEKLGTTE